MSVSRPSGLRPPSKIAKPSGIPKASCSSTNSSPPVSEASFVMSTAARANTDSPSEEMTSEVRRMSEELAQANVESRKDSLSPPDPLWEQARRLSEAGIRRGSDASVILTQDTDSFIIGDRVWVGGSKPGKIAFIGETQFAPGDWAGIVLDEPVGKNNGSVGGVHYFQCAPKHGVFSRLTKLTRAPLDFIDGRGRGEGIHANGSASAPESPRKVVTSTTSPSESYRENMKEKSPVSSPASRKGSASAVDDMKVGDRVVVSSSSGMKRGVLRFLGTTSFAAGEWAGVELDDPIGKNDGSVAGQRYFDCKPLHGLFAPMAKISKSAMGSRRPSATPVSSSTPRGSIGSTSGLRRQGSKESLSSVGSSVSSAARASRKVTRPVNMATSSQSALQMVLKEKEQHIEQLIKERDLERTDVARAANQADIAEQQLAVKQNEFEHFHEESERKIVGLQLALEGLRKQNEDLVGQLEDEKRRVEDLQFRIEEEIIAKSDLQSLLEENREKIKLLENLLEEERKRAELLEQQSCLDFETEEMMAKYKEEMENLRKEIQEYREKLQSVETSKQETNKQLLLRSNSLNENTAKLQEVQMLLHERSQEVNELQSTVGAMKEEVIRLKQQKSQQEQAYEVLTEKLGTKVQEAEKLTVELQAVQIEVGDLQRKVKASEEKANSLLLQKTKLEDDVTQLMQSSSGSSEQLTNLMSELREKEQEISRLQDRLVTTFQDKEKAYQMLEQVKENSSREEIKFQGEIQDLVLQLEKSKSDTEMAQEKLKSAQASHSDELLNVVRKKDDEIFELVRLKDDKESEVKNIQRKLAEVEKTLESLQKEKMDFIHGLEVKLENLEKEKNRIHKENEEILSSKIELQNAVLKLEAEKEALVLELNSSTSEVSGSKLKLLQASQEVEALRQKLFQHQLELDKKLEEAHNETTAMQEIFVQLQEEKKRVDQLQEAADKAQSEKLLLEEELARVKSKSKEFETKAAALEKDLEEEKLRRESLESESAKEHAMEMKKYKKEMEQLCTTKQKQIEEQYIEIMTLRTKITHHELVDSKIVVLDQEKKQLESKIVELQVKLKMAQSEANANIKDSNYQHSVSEKEASQSQIDFLNSVIVDMQKKYDDLKAQLEAKNVLKSHESSSDLNLNGLQPELRAPRLFCDICDRFDLHDTEDCPLQESDAHLHTHYHGERTADRPYCETCEMFGHTTAECNDPETF